MKYRMVLLAVVVLLAGCGTNNAPVIDKSPMRKIPAEHIVRKGDSLYSIAWGVGLDFHHIAKWNEIEKPYVIHPGQRIRLHPPTTKKTPLKSTSSAQGKKAATSPARPLKATTEKKRPSATRSDSTRSAADPKKWKWPAKGKVIGKYDPSKGINGIQISGRDGSTITSTAPGQVVYVGEGLRGYGKLVIIKHSDTFLSAYAHNKSILVAEGDTIKVGQKIAQMGNTDASRTMLHFEIRKHGKPVDPLRYLN